MLIEILNKVFYIILFLSALNVSRNAFFLIGSFVKSDTDNPQKFRLSKTELLFLGLSIAYILTCIVTGINISV